MTAIDPDQMCQHPAPEHQHCILLMHHEGDHEFRPFLVTETDTFGDSDTVTPPTTIEALGEDPAAALIIELMNRNANEAAWTSNQLLEGVEKDKLKMAQWFIDFYEDLEANTPHYIRTVAVDQVLARAQTNYSIASNWIAHPLFPEQAGGELRG